jgi:hypothetical protein
MVLPCTALASLRGVSSQGSLHNMIRGEGEGDQRVCVMVTDGCRGVRLQRRGVGKGGMKVRGLCVGADQFATAPTARPGCIQKVASVEHDLFTPPPCGLDVRQAWGSYAHKVTI